MSERKYCCQVYEPLIKKVMETELASLNKAVEESKVPEYVIAPVRNVVEQLDNYCPVCRGGINEVVAMPVEKIREPQKAFVLTENKRTPCNACEGKKIVAGRGTDDPVKCIICHGRGYLDKDTHVED